MPGLLLCSAHGQLLPRIGILQLMVLGLLLALLIAVDEILKVSAEKVSVLLLYLLARHCVRQPVVHRPACWATPAHAAGLRGVVCLILIQYQDVHQLMWAAACCFALQCCSPRLVITNRMAGLVMPCVSTPG
jgi:hypothetical protein